MLDSYLLQNLAPQFLGLFVTVGLEFLQSFKFGCIRLRHVLVRLDLEICVGTEEDRHVLNFQCTPEAVSKHTQTRGWINPIAELEMVFKNVGSFTYSSCSSSSLSTPDTCRLPLLKDLPSARTFVCSWRSCSRHSATILDASITASVQI
jgi:hypothetical protein